MKWACWRRLHASAETTVCSRLHTSAQLQNYFFFTLKHEIQILSKKATKIYKIKGFFIQINIFVLNWIYTSSVSGSQTFLAGPPFVLQKEASPPRTRTH